MRTSKLTLVYNLNTYIVTVTCITIARQQLGKHIPVEANVCNNRTAIARQWISKHASLIVEAVFSAWSMQSGCKEVQNSSREVKSRVLGRHPAGICA
jgi:hypothetical protein